MLRLSATRKNYYFPSHIDKVSNKTKLYRCPMDILNKLHKDYFSGLHFPTMDLTVWIKSENLLHVLPRSAGSEKRNFDDMI